MDSINCTLVDFNSIQVVLKGLSAMDAMEVFEKELNHIGNKIVAQMRANAPVATVIRSSKKYASRNHLPGNLRNSIGKKVGGTGIPTLWVSVNRRKAYDAWYQHFVVGGREYGGTTTRPNPFVRNTYDQMEGLIGTTMKNRIENKIKALAKK